MKSFIYFISALCCGENLMMGTYATELYNRIKNDKECIVQPDGSFSGLHVRADLSADVDFKIGDIQTNIVIDFIDSEGVRQLRVRFETTTINVIFEGNNCLKFWVENYQEGWFLHLAFCRMCELLIAWRTGYLPGQQITTLFRGARQWRSRFFCVSADKEEYIKSVQKSLDERKHRNESSSERRKLIEIYRIMHEFCSGFYNTDNPLRIYLEKSI